MTGLEKIASAGDNQINVKDVKKQRVENLSQPDADEEANKIVSNPENINQIQVFPNLWNSLNNQQKSKLLLKLEWEIGDAVKELRDLWIEREYSSEIMPEDEQKINEFNFVRENRDKIPQSWSKIEMKVKEVAEETEKDIKKEWLDRKLVQ